MPAKLEERKKAVELRSHGLSYSEILKKVHVSKSSVSLWLSKQELDKEKKDRIRKRLRISQLKGAETARRIRIEKTLKITKDAISEIKNIKNKDLFYMGVMLYWAEGAKQKNSISQGVDFSNSDPRMCKLFLKWLTDCLKIEPEQITLNVYIHESHQKRIGKVLQYWVDVTRFPPVKFHKTCLTKTIYPRKKKRSNHGVYYGQLRIKVKKSTDLNRKIAGWVDGICLISNIV